MAKYSLEDITSIMEAAIADLASRECQFPGCPTDGLLSMPSN